MNTTSKVLQDNVRPMQTPEESLAEIEQMEKAGTIELNSNRVQENDEPNKKRAACKNWLLEQGIDEKNASEIGSLFTNPDAYPYRIELHPRSAVVISKIIAQNSISQSILEFYKKLLISVFSDAKDFTSEERQAFTSQSVVNYALSCYELHFSPFDVAYVKPVFDKDSNLIKPFVLLAGMEHLLMQSAQSVKIKYEIASKETKVYLPVDPDQDLNSTDSSDMYWDTAETAVPENIKCTITYSEDSKSYEVEGYSFAKGDIALTPFWAKNYLLMMQHTAFKRAARVIINSPLSAFDEFNLSPVLTDKQLERKVTRYENDINSATIYTIGGIQRSINSHKRILGKFYAGLSRLIVRKIAELKVLENEKTIVVNSNNQQTVAHQAVANEQPSPDQLENENGFTILTNKNQPPKVISETEKNSVWQSLGGGEI